MKISLFTFHVDSSKEEDFRELVADYFKSRYPSYDKSGTLTLSCHRLVVATYDVDWLWCEVADFVEGVLREAREKDILVVCESVKF